MRVPSNCVIWYSTHINTDSDMLEKCAISKEAAANIRKQGHLWGIENSGDMCYIFDDLTEIIPIVGNYKIPSIYTTLGFREDFIINLGTVDFDGHLIDFLNEKFPDNKS